MRSLRVLLIVALAAFSFMTMTGISSCRGSAANYTGANLYIYEETEDYFLDAGEGWETGQMEAYLWWDSSHSPSSTEYLNVTNLVWHIANPSILTINMYGVVEGLAPGSTNIYATYNEPGSGSTLISNTVTFTVEGFAAE